MNTFKFKSLIAFALIIGVTCSCQKEKNLNPNSQEFGSPQGNSSMIVLGRQLENPYSVKNMTKAKENLKASKKSRESSSEIEVTTTHLYIKFKPKNEEEFSLLKKDSTLILFAYPMDYEIAKQGDYYHDPTIPEGLPTYQYTAVKVDKNIDYGVDYEVLANLFIPDEEQPAASNARAASRVSIEELVDEALAITGNLEENAQEDSGSNLKNARPSSANARRAEWTPSGRVTVWDNVVNDFVPVVDVVVRAKRWFTVHPGITGSDGTYRCDGSFRREADYSLVWEKYHFSIRTGTFGQAEVGNSNTDDSWSPQFGARGSTVVNDGQQYYALIFQGARDYYYGNRFGLSSPPRNSALHPQVKISADFQGTSADKDSHAAMYARTGGILPSSFIRRWGTRSDVVYAVTTHELAHAAHWDMDRDAFRDLVKIAGLETVVVKSESSSANAVIESWANGVEWQFAMERYFRGFNLINYQYMQHRNNGNYQEQSIAFDREYTPIVVDMIDNENQRFTRHSGSILHPNDNVSGYTILQIEQGLKGARSWNSWRDNMNERHINPTSVSLVELFANWH